MSSATMYFSWHVFQVCGHQVFVPMFLSFWCVFWFVYHRFHIFPKYYGFSSTASVNQALVLILTNTPHDRRDTHAYKDGRIHMSGKTWLHLTSFSWSAVRSTLPIKPAGICTWLKSKIKLKRKFRTSVILEDHFLTILAVVCRLV